MPNLDRDRLIAALVYLIIALFLAGNLVAVRHRLGLRRATVVLYGLVLAGVLAWTALWLTGVK